MKSLNFCMFHTNIMGQYIPCAGRRFLDNSLAWRFLNHGESSSIEDILDSLNEAIEDVLENVIPRVSKPLKCLCFSIYNDFIVCKIQIELRFLITPKEHGLLGT